MGKRLPVRKLIIEQASSSDWLFITVDHAATRDHPEWRQRQVWPRPSPPAPTVRDAATPPQLGLDRWVVQRTFR